MTTLKKKIDFIALVSADHASTNIDPTTGNWPRMTYNGYAEMTDVSLKRKFRDRMQDYGERIYVQREDRSDDGCTSLKERAESVLKGIKDKELYRKTACETWTDVRAFGGVFAFKKEKDASSGLSVGVRGPVTVRIARTVAPVEVASYQITKSVNGDPSETMSSDRMGTKCVVRHGLFVVKGSINPNLAEKTGFTEEDAELLKKCIWTMFENDDSAARPAGSMEVVRLYWFEHNEGDVLVSTAAVHRSVSVKVKDGIDAPNSIDDYEISVKEVPGTTLQVLSVD